MPSCLVFSTNPDGSVSNISIKSLQTPDSCQYLLMTSQEYMDVASHKSIFPSLTFQQGADISAGCITVWFFCWCLNRLTKFISFNGDSQHENE